MADETCTATQLTTEAKCYSTSCLHPMQQKALLIYAKALQLAALAGTDYTDDFTQLLTDAIRQDVKRDAGSIMAARINLAFRDAEADGATVPETVGDALEASKCLLCSDPLLLELADLLLTCKLG